MQYEHDCILGPLPELFRFQDGTRLTDPTRWPQRRQELLDAVVPLLYGGLPPLPQVLKLTKLFSWRGKLHSWLIETGTKDKTITFELQLHTPGGTGPFPVLLTGDGCFGYCTDEVIAQATRRGWLVAKFNRTVLAKDDLEDQRRVGGLYDVYPEGSFGAIAAWAWGYHRCVDALLQIPEADGSCIAITGHSRGGKTTLLAGATDERILFTQDSASGAGGGGCFRYAQYESETQVRARGLEDSRCELLEDLMRVIPFWFGSGMHAYVGKEDTLPFDQHFLKAAIAPRYLLQSNYLDDIWANPRGAEHTYLAARELYAFLGAEERIASVTRPGEHYQYPEDFARFLDFADAARRG